MLAQYRDRLTDTLRQSRRALHWAIGLTLVFGLLGIGQPLDRLATTLRNKLQPVEASGEIVVVGIDSASLRGVGPWPWPRSIYGEMADRLFAAGARRVYFDLEFGGRALESENKAFGEAIKRSGGRTYILPNHRVDDGSINDPKRAFPDPVISEHAQFVNNDVTFGFGGAVWSLPFTSSVAGKQLPSVPASLAGVTAGEGSDFPPNYAIDARSIPYVSAVDILSGRFEPGLVNGRDVIIGSNDANLGDRVNVPGQSSMGGVFANVIGAETLKRGIPTVVPWFVPALLFGTLMVLTLGARRFKTVAMIAAALMLSMVIVPIWTERSQIFVDLSPSLMFVLSLLIGHRQSSLGRRLLANHASGLTLLPDAKAQEDVAGVVAVLAGNLNEIQSLVGVDAMRDLWTEVVRRIQFANRGAQIFHPEDDALIWTETTGDLDDLMQRLEGLDAVFRSPIMVGGRKVDLQVTCGADLNRYRDFGHRVAGAVLSAKTARESGRRFATYIPKEIDDAAWALSMLSELDAAVANGQIWVAFQPQMDLKSGRIIGAEALVRWAHPERGAIGPDKFIPLAERHGRIGAITELVIEKSAAALRELRGTGYPVEISVNVSPFLLGRGIVGQMLERAAAKHGIALSQLKLELTETGSIADMKGGAEELEELRALGVSLSIDDYGTGMATLENLRAFKVSELKIDRTFVSGINERQEDRIMVKSTIRLAHQLQMKVVAEGVETQLTVDRLKAMRCDVIQGYLVSKPLPINEFIDFLRTESAVRAA